tara:strand:+ start:2940 stop:4013 length:1074 start_codon:yes stop_codon:yes gene_type:complete
MREIKIVFHVGKQKTATSYIQKNIRSTSDLVFIGKLINSSDKKKFTGKINNIHYDLFPKYHNYLRNSFYNPTRNSYSLISQYAEQIIDIINSKPKVKQIIISDECISDYYNYLGEHNLFLVVTLGNLISKKLNSKVALTKVISFTIRNQLDIIKSFYSYNLFINKSFDNFLESIFVNRYSDFSGSLFYYEIYSMFKLITKNEWLIKLTPYEILSIENKPIFFIKEALCLSENMMNCIIKDNLETEINVTKNKSKSKSLIKKQFTTPIFKRISILNTRLNYENKSMKLPFYKLFFKKYLLPILAFIDALFMKLFSKLLIREYKLSERSKNKIYKIYKHDNKLLKELLLHYDLDKFGYL